MWYPNFKIQQLRLRYFENWFGHDNTEEYVLLMFCSVCNVLLECCLFLILIDDSCVVSLLSLTTICTELENRF